VRAELVLPEQAPQDVDAKAKLSSGPGSTHAHAAEAAGIRLLVDEPRQALDRERAQADRLEAELRRPWWRR
jgi:hypothetical protein